MTHVGQPFESEQNLTPEAIYQPTSWMTKIEFISHLMKGNNNVLLAVYGEQGGGKSTFARLLKARIDEQINTYSIAASALFDDDFFLSQLGVILNHQGEKTIDGYIEHSQNSQTHTLIIIDDAQYLSEQFLKKLLTALNQQGHSCYFHVCLIANTTLAKTLKTAAHEINEDMIHTIELEALNETEAKNYIRHRLLSRLGFLTPERLKQFYDLTDGKIVEMNTQLDGFFGHQHSTQQSRATPGHSARKTMRISLVAGAVFAALGIAFLVNPQRENASVSDKAQYVDAMAVATPAPQEPVKMAAAETQSDLSSYIPAHQLNARKQALNVASLDQKTLLLDIDEVESEEPLVLLDKVMVIPKTLKNSTAKNNTAEQHKTHPEKSAHSALAAAQPVHASTDKVLKKDSHKSQKNNARPGKYTIQLLAGHNSQALLQYARSHHITAKSKIRRTQKQGIDWYVLTFGEFDKPVSAKMAAAKLPEQLASMKPWVRPVADLQDIG